MGERGRAGVWGDKRARISRSCLVLLVLSCLVLSCLAFLVLVFRLILVSCLASLPVERGRACGETERGEGEEASV